MLHSAHRNDYSEVEARELSRSLQTILRAFAVLFSSLSVFSLEAMLFLDDNTVQDMLRNLCIIFDVPDDNHLPVHPHHASVHDYLLSDAMCTNRCFWVDGHQAHRHMASCCLQLMGDNLHRDMLGLRTPGTLKFRISAYQIELHHPAQLCYEWLY
jgi:hypothetical protein